jgi:choline monooxygenase
LNTYTTTNQVHIEKLFQSWASSVPVERALTLPSGFYTSRDIFELERQAIFGNNWLWAGRKAQLQNTGDFLTDRFLSEPYLINIDNSLTLRAHYNVCCHHGMRLVANGYGRFTNNDIVCPYHGWTYDFNGHLKKATRLKTIEQFKASKIQLKPIAVQAIGPFIYLNFNFLHRDPFVSDTSHIEHIDKNYLTSLNYEKLEFVVRRSYPIKCNWKVFVDNYLDGGYHVPFAHKQLSSILNLNMYRTVVDHPKTSVQCCTGEQRTNGSVVFAYIYPNLMINRYGSLMDTNIVVPVDERNCIVHIDYYSCPIDRTKTNDEQSLQESHRVQEEDIYLCEQVQLGLESQAYDSGRYAPTVEHAMHSFHRTIYDELRYQYEQHKNIN